MQYRKKRKIYFYLMRKIKKHRIEMDDFRKASLDEMDIIKEGIK